MIWNAKSDYRPGYVHVPSVRITLLMAASTPDRVVDIVKKSRQRSWSILLAGTRMLMRCSWKPSFWLDCRSTSVSRTPEVERQSRLTVKDTCEVNSRTRHESECGASKAGDCSEYVCG